MADLDHIDDMLERLERVEFQTMLSRAQTEFAGVLRAAADGIVIVLGDHKGRILRVNDNLLDMTGYRPSDLIGQPVDILVPDAQKAEHIKFRDNYLHELPLKSRPMGMAAQLNLSIQKKDGTTIPVLISINPQYLDDGVLMLLLICSEVVRGSA